MRRLAVCAPDKLRGALTAPEAAGALAAGCRDAGWDAIEHPLADGGEGTAIAIALARGGRLEPIDTVDALGRPHRGRLAVLPDGTCVVEAAEAIALGHLRPGERDVMRASSRGIAPLLLAALERGAPRVVVALGGSATVDGGLGLLSGLGVGLADGDGASLVGCGGDVPRIAVLDPTGLDPRIRATPIVVALDVESPLTGPDGAAPLFGPQKGADPDQVAVLDAGLERLGALYGPSASTPGAGAAGGLGAALLWLGAEPVPGAALVMQETRFGERLAEAHLVLTAEGAVDRQSAAGKTVAHVAGAARAAGLPCVVFGGRVDADAHALYDVGATAVLGIARRAQGLRSALRSSGEDLRYAARAVCGLVEGAAQSDDG
jgi:glycerate kinase